MTSMKKSKPVVVNRKFLLKLADEIYNPKDRSFMRLCDGTLQNGPDPTNLDRPMHCGLGELYFAMTGMQPNAMHVKEDDVIELAADLCTLNGKSMAEYDALFKKATDGVKKLRLPSDLQEALLQTVGNNIIEDDSELCTFRDVLGEILDVNDAACGDSCSDATYRKRSQAVAKKLREAAKLLP